MLTPVISGRFKKDVKRLQKRNKDMGKLTRVLDLLLNEQPLPIAYNDHPLKGDWKGFRDLHRARLAPALPRERQRVAACPNGRPLRSLRRIGPGRPPASDRPYRNGLGRPRSAGLPARLPRADAWASAGGTFFPPPIMPVSVERSFAAATCG